MLTPYTIFNNAISRCSSSQCRTKTFRLTQLGVPSLQNINTEKIHILLSLFSEIKGLMLFSAFQFRLFIQFNENVVIKLVLSNGYRKEQKP